MNKNEVFWQTYINLERELLELSRYIYITDSPDDKQLCTYSPYIADLLLRTCVEVESVSKELFFTLSGDDRRLDKKLLYDKNCLKELNNKWGVEKKVVNVTCSSFDLSKDDNLCLRPLNKTASGNAAWQKAYQKVKHDRWRNIAKGNVINFIRALGALYLLNIYMKDIKFECKYNEIYKFDISFGFKVFSIKKPNNDYFNDVINDKVQFDKKYDEESLLSVKFTDTSIEKIRDSIRLGKENSSKCIKNVLCKLNDSKFIEKFRILKENDSNANSLVELFKYKLNSEIPSNLDFNERKKRFVNSKEWNSEVMALNKHKSEDELTSENIQSEIDNTAKLVAHYQEMELMKNTIFKALDSICEISICK